MRSLRRPLRFCDSFATLRASHLPQHRQASERRRRRRAPANILTTETSHCSRPTALLVYKCAGAMARGWKWLIRRIYYSHRRSGHGTAKGNSALRTHFGPGLPVESPHLDL
jgi:hypothetical protein